MYEHVHCMDLPAGVPPGPMRRARTLGVYPDEWKARRALRELLGGSVSEGYHVVETEDGWAVVREPS